ncbi:interleukin-17C-like [Pseudoliparis swirei]|uniref:interleukin-17C-like n=1 Tax=Pseudoliparis swirei TaxID=2059687 RepID=UPI0024BD62DC|nr:interleukin-17C-like [Pseudoliparis swirei]
MTRLVSLQMFSLLVFNEHMSAARSSSGCLSPEQLSRFQRRLWGRMRVPANLLDARTCAQTAADMRGDLSNRSLSPWRYRLNVDEDRIPHRIPFAECVCGGCIINRREDLSYNSVPVFASLAVLRKSPCPQNPKKFVLNRGVVDVPVGCTCAVPKYAD